MAGRFERADAGLERGESGTLEKGIMATVAELELLRRSFGDLGDSLYRGRVLRQQQDQDRRREELEREMLNLRREDQSDARLNRRESLEAQKARHQEATAHEGRMESYQQKLLGNQQAQAGIKQLNDAFAALEQGVRNRTIPAKVANAKARALVQQMRQMPEMVLGQTPFATLLEGDGDLFQDVPGAAVADLEEVTEETTGEDGMKRNAPGDMAWQYTNDQVDQQIIWPAVSWFKKHK